MTPVSNPFTMLWSRAIYVPNSEVLAPRGLPNKILKAIKICQLQERKWLMKTYPSTDSTEDARLIAEMCGKFNEAQSNNITARPPPPSTGSASSSFPLNKKEDNEESSTWTTGKRQGMFGPEKDFYDQS